MSRHLYPIPDDFEIDISARAKGTGSQYGWGADKNLLPCKEVWRPVERYFVHHMGRFPKYEEIKIMPGYYLISSDGRLWSRVHNRFICSGHGESRRETKLICADGSTRHVKILRLVLDNFLEPPEAAKTWIRFYFEGANHINAKRWDDALVNGEYTNNALNRQHYNEVGKINRFK